MTQQYMTCQVFSSGTLAKVICCVKYCSLEPFEEISLLIKAAYRESERRLTEAFQSLGITPAQAEVLLILQQTEPLSLGELGDFLIAEGGHPSRLVDRLFQAGYVQRQSALDDRRRLEISLTEQGKAMAQQVSEVKQRMLTAARPLMEQYDIEPMKNLLETYLQGSQWAKTVEMRRQLAQKSSEQPE
ncbi:MAG: MarR family winged helix-turn-helix transcriptional regulator [Xenococcaceae cyanobacterium]